MPTPERCVERFEAELGDWEVEGFGYGPVIERASGRVVGWAGLRLEGDPRGPGHPPHLNLYFRLAHEAIGQGFGREVARGLVAWAIEHVPDVRLTAVVAPVNQASLRTCLSAGLVEVRREVHPRFPDDEPDIILEPPSVATVSAGRMTTSKSGSQQAPQFVSGPDVEELLDLWVAVNDSGGAVGFLPGASCAAVGAVLDDHLAQVAAGLATLATLRDPDGTLRAVGFWEYPAVRGIEHIATLKRLMVDPPAQGRNLGRLLHAAMIGVARRELPDVELLRLDYRSGLGLGDFYAGLGWAETGRLGQGIHLGGTDYADLVDMARRVDGGPLEPDGRH
jgi:GNAT superfamily N-acetyltransferase